MSVVDQQFKVGVKILGNPQASVNRMRITDNVKGVTYKVYPEYEEASCTAGTGAGKLELWVENIGSLPGNIYVKAEIYENGQLKTVLISDPKYMHPGMPPTWFYSNFDMPLHDLEITITVGH